MASTFSQENPVQLRARKGHDMKWSCDKHTEPIAFYCKRHDIPICHRCATKDHGHKPCELDDIEDVILERRRRLDDKQQEIAETKKQLTLIHSKIEFSATSASNHFQKVNDEVKLTHKEKLKSVKYKEGTKICLINEEADEEIRTINEKRDRRIKACNTVIEKQQLIINESQAKLISETKAISEVVSQKIEVLKSTNQHAISNVDMKDTNIKRIKQDDKTLVNETPHVLASLDDILNSNIHNDVSDCLDQIQCGVLKVKFVKGEIGGEHYGRIDGYIGKWELAKSIHIPSNINKPRVCGLIGADDVCVWDVDSYDTYVTNIRTEHTVKVIEEGSNVGITSCAPIESNVIVCGKWSGECTDGSLDGLITLYDRQWNVIRNISIPTNSSFTDVYVDVDRNGMILATQYIQSNIYVINPVDGKIVDTIVKHGKDLMGEIQALSSGDIVVEADYNEFNFISRLGEEKDALYCDEWCALRCRIDKLTDTLYITYWNRERNTYAVDQVSGEDEARRIVEYKQSDRCSVTNPCLVTPSGNLVACDGDKLFVYKKSFIV